MTEVTPNKSLDRIGDPENADEFNEKGVNFMRARY